MMRQPSVAVRLRHFLRESGHTRDDLAKSVKVTRAAVSLWCLGERHPRPRQLARIVRFFGIDLPTFYGPLVTRREG